MDLSFHVPPEHPASYAIDFSHSLPVLAAGTLPQTSVRVPSLSLFRTTVEGDGLFSVLAAYRSPAPFQSVACSAASEWTSQAGFVAGGLTNGGVALWDAAKRAKEALGLGEPEPDLTDHSDIDSVDWDDFMGQVQDDFFDRLQSRAAESICVGDEDDGDDDGDYDDLGREIYGQEACEVTSKQAPSIMKTTRNTYNKINPMSADEEHCAYFVNHESPVKALSFSLGAPHILASSSKDKVVLWDISNTTTGSVPVWERCSASLRISSLDWNIDSPYEFGCCSLEGIIEILDCRQEMSGICMNTFPLGRPCTCIRFNPHKEYEVAVSYGDLREDHSVSLWDIRKPKNSLHTSCSGYGGVHSLSWNTMDNLILVGASSSNILVVSGDDLKIISEMTTGRPSLDLRWSRQDKGVFVASYDKHLIEYKMDD